MPSDGEKIVKLVPRKSERSEDLAKFFEEYAALARTGRIDSAVVVSLHTVTDYVAASYFGISDDALKLLGAIEWFKPRLIDDVELEESEDEGT